MEFRIHTTLGLLFQLVANPKRKGQLRYVFCVKYSDLFYIGGTPGLRGDIGL